MFDETILADLSALNERLKVQAQATNTLEGQLKAANADLQAQNVQLQAENTRLQAALEATTRPKFRAHEPTGFVSLADRDFSSIGDPLDKYNSIKSQGWDPVESRGVVDPASGKSGIYLITDQSEPISPPTAVRFHHAKGFVGGDAVGIMQVGEQQRWRNKNYLEWYVAFSFRYSKNWFGNTARTNKLMYLWTAIGDAGGPCILPRVRGAGTDKLIFNIGLQGTADPREDVAQFGDTGLNPNMPGVTGEVTRGPWHQAEIYFKLNTNGKPDGIVSAWLDGVQTHRFTDWMPRNGVITREGKQQNTNFTGLYMCQVDPVYGGGPTVVPEDQELDFGHVYLSIPTGV